MSIKMQIEVNQEENKIWLKVIANENLDPFTMLGILEGAKPVVIEGGVQIVKEDSEVVSD